MSLKAAPSEAALRPLVAIAAATALLASGCAAARADCPKFKRPEQVGLVQNRALEEISGLAVSRRNAGVLWMHNDSGDGPKLYALSTKGKPLGTYTLSGASAIDWEDMAIGPGPKPDVDYLYVGDIGDNGNARKEIVVYRVPEPKIEATQSPVETTVDRVEAITLTYPDGPRDAETLMVDRNGDLYIVSKRVTARGGVYRAAFPQPTNRPLTMEMVAELPWGSVGPEGGATGGDIAADGSAIIIRRYSFNAPQATLWLREPGMRVSDAIKMPGCNVRVPLDAKGEAIAFDATGLGYYTISEGDRPPIFFVAQESDEDDPREPGGP